MLTDIRAVVQRMPTEGTSTEEYAAHLTGRLGVIARVQEMLMRGPARLDLAELLEDEFLSQGISSESVETSTASLLLDPPVAALMALALHELVTNAIKFGALGAPSGKLSVSWESELRPDGWTVIDWREALVGMRAPVHRESGFGFELIRYTLPHEIGARTFIELTPRSLHCRLAFRAKSTGH